MTLEQAKQVQAYLQTVEDDPVVGNAAGLAEARAILDAEVTRLEKRGRTKFYVIERVIAFLRHHHEEFAYSTASTYPRETVESMFEILETEGWL